MNKKNIDEKVIFGEEGKYGVIKSYAKVRINYESEEEVKAIYDPFIVVDGAKDILPIFCIGDSIVKEKMMEIAKNTYKEVKENIEMKFTKEGCLDASKLEVKKIDNSKINIGDIVKYKKYHLKNELFGEVIEIIRIEDSKENKDYIGQRIYTILNFEVGTGVGREEKVSLDEIKEVYKKQ